MGGGFKHTSKRNLNDYYPTPWTLVDRLLEVEVFTHHILEPCCGEARTIASRLLDYKFKVTEYDLFSGPEESRRDFLCETRKFPAIITNPPFGLAKEFLTTALKVADKVAFLLPLDYLHGKDRYNNIWANNSRLKTVYVLVRRPNFKSELRPDGKYVTGSVTFAWFVFENRGDIGPPVISWIDNSEDVYRVRG